MTITFRPHHFMCALSFQGKGYSAAFVENFTEIMAQLQAERGDEIEIGITPHTDSICAPCPSKRGQFCAEQKKITTLDHAHAEILQLNDVNGLTWGEAKQRIATFMSLEKFHQACTGCEWKNLGICEKVLTDFLRQANTP
jgi:hypothetical protein